METEMKTVSGSDPQETNMPVFAKSLQQESGDDDPPQESEMARLDNTSPTTTDKQSSASSLNAAAFYASPRPHQQDEMERNKTAGRIDPKQLLLLQRDEVPSTPSSLTTPPAMPTRKQSRGDGIGPDGDGESNKNKMPPAPPYFQDCPSQLQSQKSSNNNNNNKTETGPVTDTTTTINTINTIHTNTNTMVSPQQTNNDSVSLLPSLADFSNSPYSEVTTTPRSIKHGNPNVSSSNIQQLLASVPSNDDWVYRDDVPNVPAALSPKRDVCEPSSPARTQRKITTITATATNNIGSSGGTISDPSMVPPTPPSVNNGDTPSAWQSRATPEQTPPPTPAPTPQRHDPMRQEKLRIAHGAMTGTLRTPPRGLLGSSREARNTSTTTARRNAKTGTATTPITSQIPDDLLQTFTVTPRRPPAIGVAKPTPMYVATTSLTRDSSVCSGLTMDSGLIRSRNSLTRTKSSHRQSEASKNMIPPGVSALRRTTSMDSSDDHRRYNGLGGILARPHGMSTTAASSSSPPKDLSGVAQISSPDENHQKQSRKSLIDPVGPPTVSSPAIGDSSARKRIVHNKNYNHQRSIGATPIRQPIRTISKVRPSDEKDEYRRQGGTPPMMARLAPPKSLFGTPPRNPVNNNIRPSDEKASYRHNPSAGMVPNSPAMQQRKHASPNSRPSDEKAAYRCNPSAGMVPMPPPASPSPSPAMQQRKRAQPNRPSDEKAGYRRNPSAGMVPSSPVMQQRKQAQPGRPSDEKAAYRHNPFAGMVPIAPSPSPTMQQRKQAQPGRPSDEKVAYRRNPSAGMVPMPPSASPSLAIQQRKQAQPGRPSDEKASYRHNPSAGMVPNSPAIEQRKHAPPNSRPSDEKAAYRCNPSAGMVPMPPPASPSPSPAMQQRKRAQPNRPSDEKAGYRRNPSAGMVPNSMASPPRNSPASSRFVRKQLSSGRPSDEKAAYRHNPSMGMSSPARRLSSNQASDLLSGRPLDSKTLHRNSSIGVSSPAQPVARKYGSTPPRNRPFDEKTPLQRQLSQIPSEHNLASEEKNARHSSGSQVAQKLLMRRQPSLGDQACPHSKSFRRQSKVVIGASDKGTPPNRDDGLDPHLGLWREASSSSLNSGLDLDEDVRKCIFERSSPRRKSTDMNELAGVDQLHGTEPGRRTIINEVDEVASFVTGSESQSSTSHAPDEKAAYRQSAGAGRPMMRRTASYSTTTSGVDLSDDLRNNIINRASAHATARRRTSAEVLRWELSDATDGSVIEDVMRQAEGVTRSQSFLHGTDGDKEKSRASNLTLASPMPGAYSVAALPPRHSTKGLQLAPPVHVDADDANDQGSISAPTPYAAESNIDDNQGDESGAPELLDMEAQAGVPVLSPGAFAIDGVEPSQLPSGYDSEYEESDDDGPQEVREDAEDHQPEVGTEADVPSAPLQASLYQETVAVDALNAEVLTEADEEAEKTRFRRKFRFALGLAILLLGAVLAGTFLGTRGTTKKQAAPSGQCPSTEGWSDVGGVLVGPTEDDGIMFGFSVAMTGEGNRIAVGLPGLDIDVTETKVGSVVLLDYNGTNWIESSMFLGPGKNAQAGTATALAKDGRMLAVGSPFWNGGEVGVYQQNDINIWSKMAIIDSPESDDSEGRFGGALAMSADGNVLAISDRNANNNVGSVRVFQKAGSDWIAKGDAILGENELEFFGWAVSLSFDGQRLAATARDAPDFAGKVRTFDFVDGAWAKSAELAGSQPREFFGNSMELSADGSRLAIGSTGYSNALGGLNVGKVTVFETAPGTTSWIQIGQDMEGSNDFDSSGFAVSLSDDGGVLAFGTPENDLCGSNSGRINVFTFDGAAWTRLSSSVGSTEPDEGAEYGFSVALSSNGTRVVGGAPSATYNGYLSDVGEVRVFDLDA